MRISQSAPLKLNVGGSGAGSKRGRWTRSAGAHRKSWSYGSCLPE